jgi:hypothetical protein
MPITPEIKNRSDRERIGGASATMIRAEENAEDQINANAKPAKIARMSIGCLSLTYRQELRAVSRPEQGYFAQTKAVAQTKARARDPARAFVKTDLYLAVYAVFQRFCDGHFYDFIRIFFEAFTGGGVAHHPLWTLTAIDFANARQSHSATARNFAGDQFTDRIQRGGRGFFIRIHFLCQRSDQLCFRHRFRHIFSPNKPNTLGTNLG